MKRAAACVFSSILWLLIICTILSVHIKQWMTPQTVAVKAKYDQETFQTVLPADSVISDDSGTHLFQIIEGSGWESGSRAQEFPADGYVSLPEQIILEFTYGNDFIQYTSQPLKDNKSIEVFYPPLEKGNDVWLAVFPDGVPPLDSFPAGIGIEGQSSAALLLSAEGVDQPFMQERAKGMVPVASGTSFPESMVTDGPQYSVYSLSETGRFVEQLPIFAIIMSICVAFFALWIYSCFLSGDWSKNRRYIVLNSGIAAVGLIVPPFLLNPVNLPSSLLPPNYIFDFGHYAKEFGEIFAALETFAAQGDQTASAALQSIHSSLTASAAVLLGGVLLAAVLIAVEALLLKRRARKILLK